MQSFRKREDDLHSFFFKAASEFFCRLLALKAPGLR
jgi:hypothetical protein